MRKGKDVKGPIAAALQTFIDTPTEVGIQFALALRYNQDPGLHRSSSAGTTISTLRFWQTSPSPG